MTLALNSGIGGADIVVDNISSGQHPGTDVPPMSWPTLDLIQAGSKAKLVTLTAKCCPGSFLSEGESVSTESQSRMGNSAGSNLQMTQSRERCFYFSSDDLVTSGEVVGGIFLSEESCSGWESCLYVLVLTSSTIVGSRSRKTLIETCFPAPPL